MDKHTHTIYTIFNGPSKCVLGVRIGTYLMVPGQNARSDEDLSSSFFVPKFANNIKCVYVSAAIQNKCLASK